MLVPRTEDPPRVQLFTTCLVEHVRPEVGMAVVDVLERAGYDVLYPDGQTCCGQPAFNTGAWDHAKAMARQTIDVLSRSTADVVVPSGSCADMVVHHAPRLLADDVVHAPRARAVAARTFELTQYLVRAGVTFSPQGAPVAARPPTPSTVPAVHYHASCHLLRGLGVRDQPLALLRSATGQSCAPLPGAEECCGFGGMFSLKMSAISAAMLDRKLDRVVECGARTITACDLGCLLHLEGGLRRRAATVAVAHVAEVLAQAGVHGSRRAPEGGGSEGSRPRHDEADGHERGAEPEGSAGHGTHPTRAREIR